ncbi:MAG: membrane protein insertion efficiency factor YidD [bacterium]|nr:membrane protein insertion efficiency factor YidD [bacterium]
MDFLNKISRALAYPFIGLIVLYQKTFSPDHGPLKKNYPYGYCKFYPTCSMYAKKVLDSQGIVGIPKIFYRILRCNPFTQSRVDNP